MGGIEWIKSGKATIIGIATGMVAGLATITPASGTVGPAGATVDRFYGWYSLLLCYADCLNRTFKIDDSLDVFPVHGVGGILRYYYALFCRQP